ncbi:MAG: hypothetical protein NC900_02615, partial [Candidatus Omnitrophica bacterium]|nr:hypothetical protein [Candidatus Omnitrophota bacterium]
MLKPKVKIQRLKIKILISKQNFYSLCLIFCVFSFIIYPAKSLAQDKPSSKELVIKAWEAHGKNDIENTFYYTQRCIELYKEEADRQQAQLKEVPKGKDIEKYNTLNDVATCYFIQAESYMRQEELEKAKEIFNLIIQKYPSAQAWDPRGWFWVISEAAKQSIKKIETGSIEIEKEKIKVSRIPTEITLFDPGKEEIVDYEKYGEFQNVGTKDYRYIIKDQIGLSMAVGEGIFPNTTSLRKNPNFLKVLKEKRLEGNHWDFLQSPDLEAGFFKWATCPEPQGVKLFYIGLLLEKSGLIIHALKAYYAIVVHFPGSYGWTYWHTPWYIGPAAIAKINFLLKRNPQIGYRLVGANIRIINGFDNDVSNDIVITDPGRWVERKEIIQKEKKDLGIRKKIGGDYIYLIQYEDSSWQLFVEDKPYLIKGITYAPTKVGQSPDEGTLGNWMEEDFNNNGKIDGPYDAFVDKNRNNLQDDDEPAIGDFKLMQEMGVNTIRLYHHPHRINKEILRDLYYNYGIRVIMGDFLGKYALGSGASWYEGTDYSNPEHQKNMLESVRRMVEEFKDEPYILFWLLGNENVYGVACNANKDPESFFKFANEVAKFIKGIDNNHPVAICSGDVLFLDKFAKYCPDIDIFGTNAYRGDYGFGNLWQVVKEESDKPVIITEYGCPAYA